MKRQYKIEIIEDAIVVLPNGNMGLDLISSSVSKYLMKRGYEGKVFFDMLILNGLNNNRFILMNFKNSKFDYSKAKEVNLKGEIAEFSNSYYLKHKSYVSDATLSRIEKQKISSYLNESCLVMA